MTRNVLEWLEQSALRTPEALAFEDVYGQITFAQLKKRAREIGTYLSRTIPSQSPVLLLMDKSPAAVTAMLGVVYAGCFYTPVDGSMPLARLERIKAQLAPAIILCSAKYYALAKSVGDKVQLLDGIPSHLEEGLLQSRRDAHIDKDLLYVLFTSGSTGTPKGVAISHRSVVDFVEWACDALKVRAGSRFGNQAPLYFDNSVLDIYCAMRMRSVVFFLPGMDFSFPARLLEDLERYAIDTIFWVPSALTAVAASGLLSQRSLSLSHVLFCGEVMPVKTLNAWREALPNARFVNMYGPTEVTDVCTWFEVTRDFSPDEALPIGFPCANTRILLIDGEICVSGTCLSEGYYNDAEKTAQVFVQNPLHKRLVDIIYRTGDMGAYNDKGELMFLGRRDSQIKRSGYRIELGEIECALQALEGVLEGCCVYLEQAQKIVCAYVGDVPQGKVRAGLKAAVPKYMLPDVYRAVASLPKTLSGKIDRSAVRQVMEGEHPLA